MEILTIAAGVLIGEIGVRVVGTVIAGVYDRRAAKQRQADLDAFSTFMLTKLKDAEEGAEA